MGSCGLRALSVIVTVVPKPTVDYFIDVQHWYIDETNLERVDRDTQANPNNNVT